MKFDKTEVFNFKGALRGMRNPLESWNKSDSCDCYHILCSDCDNKPFCNWRKIEQKVYESILNTIEETCSYPYFSFGENDIKLAQRLILAGSTHSKFMRQISVSVDITAPLYWWKEFDTYKVGTVANSESTMHKLATTPITLDCIETGDYNDGLGNYFDCASNVEGRDGGYLAEDVQFIIELLENLRQTYLETKDKRYWKELIRWLPEGWLQARTVTMSYENVRSMARDRSNHKLTEWSVDFIEWCHSLPYSEELIFIGGE